MLLRSGKFVSSMEAQIFDDDEDVHYRRQKVLQLHCSLQARQLDLQTKTTTILALLRGDKRHTHEPFPFLRLPLELRHMVYDHCFGELQYDIFGHLCIHEPPVTRTCQLIRAESLGFFYNRSTFVLRAAPERTIVPGSYRTQTVRPLRMSLDFRSESLLTQLESRFDMVRSFTLQFDPPNAAGQSALVTFTRCSKGEVRNNQRPTTITVKKRLSGPFSFLANPLALHVVDEQATAAMRGYIRGLVKLDAAWIFNRTTIERIITFLPFDLLGLDLKKTGL